MASARLGTHLANLGKTVRTVLRLERKKLSVADRRVTSNNRSTKIRTEENDARVMVPASASGQRGPREENGPHSRYAADNHPYIAADNPPPLLCNDSQII